MHKISHHFVILSPPPSFFLTTFKNVDVGRCWERLKAREGGDRGWDGWVASLTQRTWVWVNSGVGDGQGGLACCSPWGHKESDMTEQLKWTDFLPLSRLSFYFLDSVIWCTNVCGGFCFIFRFWWKKFFFFSSSDISKKPWSNPRSWSLVLIFVS